MSSLMGVDLENFILRVRSLNLRPFEHWGVAEKKKVGVIFCFNSKSCEGHRGVAIHFLVTKGEKTATRSNYVCIFYMALLLVET